MGIGLTLDKQYHGRSLSAKFKVGVAGCEYACNAPLFKGVGLTGFPEGWKVTAGGNCGAKQRMGDLMAENLTDADAMDMIHRIFH
jgi:NAD(P)H-nitrite reductase large subunit